MLVRRLGNLNAQDARPKQEITHVGVGYCVETKGALGVD